MDPTRVGRSNSLTTACLSNWACLALSLVLTAWRSSLSASFIFYIFCSHRYWFQAITPHDSVNQSKKNFITGFSKVNSCKIDWAENVWQLEQIFEFLFIKNSVTMKIQATSSHVTYIQGVMLSCASRFERKTWPTWRNHITNCSNMSKYQSQV